MPLPATKAHFKDLIQCRTFYIKILLKDHITPCLPSLHSFQIALPKDLPKKGVTSWYQQVFSEARNAKRIISMSHRHTAEFQITSCRLKNLLKYFRNSETPST